MRAIIDASVGVPYVHQQDVSRPVRRWLTRWVAVGGSLVAPAHFWLEVVNALARRHRYPGAAILEAIHRMSELPITSVQLDESGLILVIDATERHLLSAYDAQYLALSQQLDLPLVTLDRRLADAAGLRAIDPMADGARLSESRASYGDERRVTWPDYAEAASYLARLRADVASDVRA